MQIVEIEHVYNKKGVCVSRKINGIEVGGDTKPSIVIWPDVESVTLQKFMTEEEVKKIYGVTVLDHPDFATVFSDGIVHRLNQATVDAPIMEVAPGVFQSHDDLEANLQQDEAQDEKNIDEWNGDLPPNESNVY